MIEQSNLIYYFQNNCVLKLIVTKFKTKKKFNEKVLDANSVQIGYIFKLAFLQKIKLIRKANKKMQRILILYFYKPLAVKIIFPLKNQLDI
jgi:hypothetical protein